MIIARDEQAKIDAFIKKKGITKCPATQSPEFVKLMQKKDEAYRNMTFEEKWKAGLSKHRPRSRRKKQ